jgi:predicted amidophosphoribosyltransferase
MPGKGLDLTRCEKCRKLFGRQTPGQVVCSNCAEALGLEFEGKGRRLSKKDLSLAQYLSSLIGLSSGAVEEAIIAQNQRDETGEGQLCPKCQERRVEEGEEYCWNCQMELFQSFRKAAESLKNVRKYVPVMNKYKMAPPAHATNLLKEVQGRINRSGKKHVKWEDFRTTRSED